MSADINRTQPVEPPTAIVVTRPLGLVDLDARTFEHDLAVSERYQAFSTELLRLALLGLGGVGFLLVKLDPGTAGTPSAIRANMAVLVPFLYATVISLGICCAASLAHRYVSSDGLAYHLKYVRLLRVGAPPEDKRVLAEKQGRSRRWRAGTFLLMIAAGSLATGALSLALGFVKSLSILAGGPVAAP